MPYYISTTVSFAAAHALRGYSGACERTHGHNFTVTAVVKTSHLDNIGIAYDFKKLRHELNKIIELLDHNYLNNIGIFATVNPTAENIAVFIYRELAPVVKSEGAVLKSVTVGESESNRVTYEEEV